MSLKKLVISAMKRQKLASQARQQVAKPDMGVFLVRIFIFWAAVMGVLATLVDQTNYTYIYIIMI